MTAKTREREREAVDIKQNFTGHAGSSVPHYYSAFVLVVFTILVYAWNFPTRVFRLSEIPSTASSLFHPLLALPSSEFPLFFCFRKRSVSSFHASRSLTQDEADYSNPIHCSFKSRQNWKGYISATKSV